MLAMLMAGVLLKPVLAFAGGLHEAEHAVLAEDGHDSRGDVSHDDRSHDDGSHGGDFVGEAAPEPADPSDAKNPWHALMHFGHCCGQAPALLALAYIGPQLPTAEAPLPPWSAAFTPAAQPVALRPPITT